jgi:serine/threonine protein kinase
LAERRGLDYAVQIAQGLAAAHEKEIVHRDLKPENLFVTTSGRIKILDFGLAKLAPPEALAGAESTSVATLTRLGTSPGIAVGTPAYMSPEQLRGLPVDGRSDIFSFGLVLCELFSGRHPFQRPTSVETMNAILTADPFVGEGADGSLPQGVQLIASHCLEKDPHHRFQSAQDLAFNLGALSGSSRSVAAAEAHKSTGRSQWWPRIRLATEALVILSLAAAVLLPRRPEVHSAPQLNAAILPPPGRDSGPN